MTLKYSCEDLQGSIYFGPNALRHCCQRFFVNGQRRGDVEILKVSKDSKGKRLNIIELEMSYKRLIPNVDEPSSYINFYIANNGVVMPSFNDEKADNNAQKILETVFPDRKIVAINGIDISMGGGNVHCITQQQPLSIKDEA